MVVNNKYTNLEDDTSDIDEVIELPDEIAKQYKKYELAGSNVNGEEVFCICRQPDTGELMIMCDCCEDWFHFKCMHLNKRYSNLVSKFYCKFCQWKGEGTTKWKRKCRLDGCYEPIMSDSKYCSQEHGKLYLKQVLVDRPNSRNDLSLNVVNDILTHVGQDHDKLLQLGTKFPQLDQVTQFITSGDGDIPQQIKQNIANINQQLCKVQAEIESYKTKSQTLAEVKDKIKLLNDRLSSTITIEDGKKLKKSKSKTRKIDICCYDKKLDISDLPLINTFDNEETFDDLVRILESRMEEDDSGVGWYKDQMCIQDRKRCVRHNGWWNLINDEILSKVAKLQLEAKETQDEKDQVLKDYSISIYESMK
jgi:COMPASS component SPP1